MPKTQRLEHGERRRCLVAPRRAKGRQTRYTVLGRRRAHGRAHSLTQILSSGGTKPWQGPDGVYGDIVAPDIGHDNVWYRVAAGGRLGREGVGARTRTRVRLACRGGLNRTWTLQTSARVLMPHRQQQTTQSCHQVLGRMADLIGKDEYQ